MLEQLIEIILHTDDAILIMVSENIKHAFIVLFLLIMFETGLIVFPFLPGDSLLFSAGVVAAAAKMNILFLLFFLITAAILGNMSNYYVGKFLGFELRKSKNFFIKNHLIKYMPQAEAFYQKHGGGAIVLGRFFPIIRTYIPFLAGVVKMETKVFVRNSVIGAILWISLFLLTGYFIGEIPWVKANYGAIFLGLVLLSLTPLLLKLLLLLKKKKTKSITN